MVKPIDPKRWPLLAAAFSPDGSLIAFSGGGFFTCLPKIWIARVPSLETVTMIEGHRSGVTALAWSERGLISASSDCSVRLWDIERHSHTNIVKGDQRAKTRLALGKDDSLWIGEAEFSQGKTARLLRASLDRGKVSTATVLPNARLVCRLAIDRATDRWAYRTSTCSIGRLRSWRSKAPSATKTATTFLPSIGRMGVLATCHARRT